MSPSPGHMRSSVAKPTPERSAERHRHRSAGPTDGIGRMSACCRRCGEVLRDDRPPLRLDFLQPRDHDLPCMEVANAKDRVRAVRPVRTAVRPSAPGREKAHRGKGVWMSRAAPRSWGSGRRPRIGWWRGDFDSEVQESQPRCVTAALLESRVRRNGKWGKNQPLHLMPHATPEQGSQCGDAPGCTGCSTDSSRIARHP